MYSPREILNREPAVLAGAVTVIVNALALFGVVDVSVDQLGAVNVAVVAVLSLFVRQSVTPNGKL